MKKIYLLLATVAFALQANAQDQKFLDFQSAKIAYEKYDDCAEAKKLMEPIYNDFKEDMSFVHLYAKVLTCLNKYKEALTVLQTYNEAAQDPAISEQIAELNYKLKAGDLTGTWMVTYSNGEGYASSTLTLTKTGDYLSLQNSWDGEYGSANVVSEDDSYITFKGTYTATYHYMYRYQTAVQIAFGTGVYNEEGRSTTAYWNVTYTYNKRDKTFSFSIPKAKPNNDGDVYSTSGEWSITAKKKQ